MDSLSPGDPRRLGAYRLLGRLGAGGMGQVYLARSDRGRTVAVKLVRRELADQEEFRRRFAHEVQAARRVGGAWTAPVLDADTEAEIPWVATGYIAGPSLQRVVARDHGPLPERSVRVLGAGLARALQAVHAAGIVHRDLKPSNVLITLDGPRVIDFGIARALDSATHTIPTQSGSAIGSPGFMSPEQIRGVRLTPASDVFCLGSVLVFAASGRMPFGPTDSGVHAVMYRIAQEEPDLTGVPESLLPLITALLAKDPAQRPTTAQALALTGVEDLLTDLRTTSEPWLPSKLTAQLGRHAVQLLDVEDPDGHEPAEQPGTAAETQPPKQPEQFGESGQFRQFEHSKRPEQAADGTAATVAVTDAAPPAGGAAPSHGQSAQPGAHDYPTAPNPAAAQPAGHGYPPPRSTPPATGPAPAASAAAPRPKRRSQTTLVLATVITAALIGGGATFFALGNGDKSGHDGAKGGGNPSSAPTTPGGTDTGGGDVPSSLLGTWQSPFSNANGAQTRTITIHQATSGSEVAEISGSGTTSGGGPYHCAWTAPLTSKGTSGSAIDLGPSAVTAAEPKSSCRPGDPSTLTLRPDGRLRRDFTGSGTAPITYTKQK